MSERTRDLTSSSRAIEKRARVAGSLGEVWASWTTSAGFSAFLGAECKIELQIGGAFEIYFNPEAPVGERGSERCKVLSYLPERMLSFSWNGPPTIPELREEHTWVVLQFDPVEGGVDVSLTHLGWGEGGRWDELYAYFDRNWGAVLDQLCAHFAGTDTDTKS